MVVNLSGRGDKDLDSVAEHLGASSDVASVLRGTSERQRRIGWVILIVVSVAYIVYFLKVRLFAAGPAHDARNGCSSSARS